DYFPHPCFLTEAQSSEYIKILERLSAPGDSLQLHTQKRALLQKSLAYLDVLEDLTRTWSKQPALPTQLLVFCPPGSPAQATDAEEDDDRSQTSHLSRAK